MAERVKLAVIGAGGIAQVYKVTADGIETLN